MDEISKMGRIFLARRRLQAERIRCFDITIQQMALIGLARQRGAVSPSEAAEALFCDRPTASVIAKHCVWEGWLEKSRRPEDRRSHRLHLTGSGEELLDRIEASRLAMGPVGDALDILSEAEALAFRAALEKVEARAMELYAEQRRER